MSLDSLWTIRKISCRCGPTIILYIHLAGSFWVPPFWNAPPLPPCCAGQAARQSISWPAEKLERKWKTNLQKGGDHNYNSSLIPLGSATNELDLDSRNNLVMPSLICNQRFQCDRALEKHPIAQNRHFIKKTQKRDHTFLDHRTNISRKVRAPRRVGSAKPWSKLSLGQNKHGHM